MTGTSKTKVSKVRAIANQRDRRNLDDAELASLVLAVDRRRKAGRPPKELFPSEKISNSPSHVETAALTGTSKTKVSKVRAIADYAEATGDSEEKDAVMAGTMSINRAERQVRAKKEAVVSERVAEAMEWWRTNGNMPIRRARVGAGGPAPPGRRHRGGAGRHRPGRGMTGDVAGAMLIDGEIAKCEVVCANCHRIRTWGRKRANAEVLV